MKICAESLPGKPRGMLMLRKVFSILVLCIVCTAFADGQDEKMNYIRHHGGCERCALTTCSKCPTEFHGTKPMEPLKIKEQSRMWNLRTGDSMNGSLAFVNSAGKM